MESETAKKAIGYGTSALLFGVAAAVTAFVPDCPSWLTGILSSVGGIANLFGIKVTIPSKAVRSKRKDLVITDETKSIA